MRHYKDGDLKKIKLQKEQMHEDCGSWELFNDEDTIVFEDDERVLAIVRPFFERGGRVWLSALIGVDCKDKAIPVFKKMKKLIDDWLYCKDVERVEMITQTDFVQANRLAELLGFKKEGTLKKYYNGIDFNIWGRIN
jgi:hypothetical protein